MPSSELECVSEWLIMSHSPNNSVPLHFKTISPECCDDDCVGLIMVPGHLGRLLRSCLNVC